MTPDLLCVEQLATRLVIRGSSRIACWAWLRVLRTGKVPRSEHDVQVFAALELADAKGRRITQSSARAARRPLPAGRESTRPAGTVSPIRSGGAPGVLGGAA